MQTAQLTCPFCQHNQTQNLSGYLDLEKHPRQRLALLTDSFFTVTCKACKQQYAILHELLVKDGHASFAILLAPDTDLKELDSQKPEFEDFTLRLVGNQQELKEKLLILDSALDDRTIELCKLYLLMQMQQPNHTLLYSDQQQEEGKLYFSILSEEGVTLGSVSCELKLYTQLLRVTQEFPLQKGWFSRVDQNWAYEHIKKKAL